MEAETPRSSEAQHWCRATAGSYHWPPRLRYGPFRRRYRCAPVHRETGEMVAILSWCAPAFGVFLLAMALVSLNDDFEGSSREDRRLLPHLATRTTGAHGHSVSHTGALR